eukprot:SAG22_NODE_152_length_17377_cov_191.856928_12_plen_93_part_00
MAVAGGAGLQLQAAPLQLSKTVPFHATLHNSHDADEGELRTDRQTDRQTGRQTDGEERHGLRQNSSGSTAQQHDRQTVSLPARREQQDRQCL